ncbi:uncharacterized protein [Montipora foliosa]|uniref:uncharacterized protein n=1 Tax=Montipora foliosa TaxID=591990 RepID=UPI0035F13633
MLVDDQNLQTLKDKLVHAVIAFDKFKEAHFDYWSEVRDTVHMEECRNYLTKHVSDFDTFRDEINGWIAQAEHRLLVSAFDVNSEVNPEDSVSRVDSQEEARKLLKKRFGDEYRVASAYESKALAWPPIKSEDSTALNKFAIFLSSCKNALAGSQYASKFDQPGNIQKLIFKLPFNTRERWRRSADDIMERHLRPVEFNDLVAFMDREARIATNPVFGNISGNDQPFFNSRERKPSQPNHALEDCHLLRWKPYQERIKFLSAKRLCFGCLSEKHVARLCPERKICKIPNCTRKHPTVLHTSNVREKSLVDVGVGTGDSTDTPVLNAMANTEKCSSSLDLGEARPRTAMAVIPVKIRLKSSNQTIITYAFLDNGSSATFCTESLMRKLGVYGTKAKISLSTLEKKNSPVDSYLIRDLVVSDLDENHFVHLPTLYTRPEIPVSKEDIPTQEDEDQWPHLDGVFIPQVDAEIGLLIASDVPEALDPVEVKHIQNGGPYATRTCMGWAVNGPLGVFGVDHIRQASF